MSHVDCVHADNCLDLKHVLCGYSNQFISCSVRTLILICTISIGNVAAHAAKVPGLIFLSGQTPVDINGNIVPGGIEEHTVSLLLAPLLTDGPAG